MTMNGRDKLAAGRLMAAERFTYFRAGIYGMLPKPAPGLGTFGTTKRGVMFWDPACAEKWSIEEICAVVLHELFHWIRDHSGRCDCLGAEPKLFNIAGDEEINDDLENAGLKLPLGDVDPRTGLPAPPVTCEAFGHKRGLTAEEYYRLLEKQQQQQSQPQSGGKGKKGKKGEKGKGQGQGPGAVGDKPMAGGGFCGGVAGRKLPDGLEGADGGAGDKPGDKPGTEYAKGRSDLEIQRIRKQVAEAIRSEAQKGRGTIPGGWSRWADSMLAPPKVRWQNKLAKVTRGAVMARFGALDYCWKKPSRRQWGIGFGAGRPILPALWAPQPNVTVAVDTSGSMGTAELMRAASETQGILKATGASVTFAACDAAVHALKPLGSMKDLQKLLLGGGGTDFRPVFEAVAKARVKPDVLVFITDGQGPAPQHPPRHTKVIWILVGKGQCHPSFDGGAEWGEFVSIDD